VSATLKELVWFVPLGLVLVGALTVICLDLVVPPKVPRRFLGFVSLVFLAGVIGLSLHFLGENPRTAFSGLVTDDDFSRCFTLIFAIASALATLIAMGRLPDQGVIRGEFYSLLLISTAGAALLSRANDLMLLFVGLECLSIPAYVLAAGARKDLRSTEAGWKYFILGAFATGLWVYGMALIYGASGSTELSAIARATTFQPWTQQFLLIFGTILIFAALCFKAGVVPFHMWVPDVYQGSPTPATAFFATAIKAAAFAALLRVLYVALPELRAGTSGANYAGWFNWLHALAILTMTVPNIIALAQTDVKRLLAYSSIAHTGYLLIGLLAEHEGGTAILFYLGIYTFMTAGSFAAVAFFEREDGRHDLSHYVGAARHHPWMAAAFAVFLFSLAGIPPTAGFFGKLYLFRAAIRYDLVFLTVIAVLNSLVSAVYYLRVIVAMYMQEESEASQDRALPSLAIGVAVGICLLFVLLLGVYPGPYLEMASLSIATLF